MESYGVMILIVVLSMIMELVHLSENESLKRKENNNLKIISVLIIAGAICEFLGVYLDGKDTETRVFHTLVKVIEFSIAPTIPFFFCRVIDLDNISKKAKAIIGFVLGSNVLLEVVNFFVPFIFYIDENNYYHRANYYFVYFTYYNIGVVVFVIVLLRTIKKYQNKNIASLFSMIGFLLTGFIIRLFDSNIRTDWLVVAIIEIAFISYYSDLILKVDYLTQLLNRRAYENYLRKIDYSTCIIRMDINRFKIINDTYGHQCGDRCLKTVASTILKAYGNIAYCFRTGGDEFDIILKPNQLQQLVSSSEPFDLYKAIDKLNSDFDELLEKETDKYPMLSAGCSKGYGIFYGFVDSTNEGMQDKRFTAGTLLEVVNVADKRMYEDKRAHAELEVKKAERATVDE